MPTKRDGMRYAAVTGEGRKPASKIQGHRVIVESCVWSAICRVGHATVCRLQTVN